MLSLVSRRVSMMHTKINSMHRFSIHDLCRGFKLRGKNTTQTTYNPNKRVLHACFLFFPYTRACVAHRVCAQSMQGAQYVKSSARTKRLVESQSRLLAPSSKRHFSIPFPNLCLFFARRKKGHSVLLLHHFCTPPYSSQTMANISIVHPFSTLLLL